jgi:hypothetical protein
MATRAFMVDSSAKNVSEDSLFWIQIPSGASL